MSEEKILTRAEKNDIFIETFIVKRKLGKRDGECCNGCKKRAYLSELTIDHIKPKHLGGGEELENKQLLCSVCHLEKTQRENKARYKAFRKLNKIRKRQIQKYKMIASPVLPVPYIEVGMIPR